MHPSRPKTMMGYDWSALVDYAVAASLLLLCLTVDIVDAQAAAQIGGKPPAAVKTTLCSISNVFAQLNKIKHDKECLKGCAKVKGKCPTDWYPGKTVRAGCGRGLVLPAVSLDISLILL